MGDVTVWSPVASQSSSASNSIGSSLPPTATPSNTATSSASVSHGKTETIIGGTIGAIAAIALVILLGFCIVRRRRLTSEQRNQLRPVQPFITNSRNGHKSSKIYSRWLPKKGAITGSEAGLQNVSREHGRGSHNPVGESAELLQFEAEAFDRLVNILAERLSDSSNPTANDPRSGSREEERVTSQSLGNVTLLPLD